MFIYSDEEMAETRTQSGWRQVAELQGEVWKVDQGQGCIDTSNTFSDPQTRVVYKEAYIGHVS